MGNENTLRVLEAQGEILERVVGLLERSGGGGNSDRIPLLDPTEGIDSAPHGYEYHQGNYGEWKSLADFHIAVRNALVPGGTNDPRLEKRATGLSEGIGSEGGFLLPEGMSYDLLKGVFQTGKLLKLCFRIPITKGNSIELPAFNETSRATGSRLGGIRGYWTAEAGEKTPSKPDFRQLKLSLKKLVGLCYVTDELLEDQAVLDATLKKGFADEFGFLTDEALVNGTGSGQPLGILNASSLVTVSAEVGQASATLVAENVVRMYSRMLNPENAVWLVHRSTIPQLYTMGIVIGLGGAPIFMPAGSIAGIPYNTLFGRPVIMIEQCSALGAKGDIIFTNFTDGYVVGEKGDIQTAQSIHVKFTTDESTFRWVLRLDGQPVLASAITPFKGSDDLSHFVTLEART